MAICETEAPETGSATERRLVLRLVDYWEDIRGAWSFPLLTDFEVAAVDGLEPHCFLIDLDHTGLENSFFRFVGEKIARECGCDLAGVPVSEVPRGTLLSRLTDHYLQVLANQCPMGFEAAFSHAENMETLYRGIMLPMSDDGERIDYILGAINCREREIQPDDAENDFIGEKNGKAAPARAAADDGQCAADLPKVADRGADGGDMAASLADKLRDCRGSAETMAAADNLARKTLLETLCKAFSLANLADTAPMIYSRMLKENGIVPQPGQPFLTVLKLVFGDSRDPEELAEYAAALSYARRQGQTPETLIAFLESQEDGIKGCARAEPIPEIPISAFNRQVREGAV